MTSEPSVGADENPTWTVGTLNGVPALKFYAPGSLYGVMQVFLSETFTIRPLKLAATFLPQYPYVDGQLTCALGFFSDLAAGVGYGASLVTDGAVQLLTFGRGNGLYPTASTGTVLGAPATAGGRMEVDIKDAFADVNGYPQFSAEVRFTPVTLAAVPTVGLGSTFFPPLSGYPPGWAGSTPNRVGLTFNLISWAPVTVYVLAPTVVLNPG
jgi:hypothetical protein